MRCILGFWIFLIWLETVVLSVFCYTEIKPSINCSFLANYSGCERKTFPESLHPNVDCIDLSGNMLTYVNKIEGLDNLFYMDLSSNILKTVDNGAFASLRKLEYLDISNNEHLGLAVLPNVTNGLNQTNIKVLKVDQISCPGGRSNILQRHHLSYLDNTSLLELSIATNRIETLEPCVLSRLPKSIKRLSIARNRLIAAAYVLEYHSLVNVEVINASLRNSPFPFLRTISGCKENLDILKNDTVYHPGNCQNDLQYPLWSNTSGRLISVSAPPSLRTLYVNSSKIFSTVVKFGILPNVVRQVYLQDNIIHSWIGPMHGVENITVLDMSKNFCANIGKDVGVNLTGLLTLKLAENALGPRFQFDLTGKIFRNLRRLQFLDISYNRIQALPFPFFKNLRSINHLYVSNNLLSDWCIAMGHMVNLTTLDLSKNRIGTISPRGMAELDLVLARGNLSINLRNNKILCTCENLNFLEWMFVNRAHFKNIDLYTCSNAQKNYMNINFKQFSKSISQLKGKCKSYTLYYIIISVTGTCFLSVIFGVALYRNRWKIRYMRYTLFQRARDSHLLSSSSDDLFLYDAFVSYTSKDRDFVIKDMIQKLEQDNGVQLLIRDRSFIPGEFKCQQIVRSIQESRKTICVVSKRYLKSAWRDYELNMARVEGVEVRKSMRYVILILLPEVCNGGYPKKISDFLKRDCFIEYPDDPAGYEEFWQRLCSALQENAQD